MICGPKNIQPCGGRHDEDDSDLDPDDQVLVLTHSAQDFPNAPSTMAKRAMEARHLRGDIGSALAIHARMVAKDPANAMNHYWLACDLAAVGEVKAAINEVHIACALRPGWSRPAVEVAIILANTGKLSDALQVIEEATANFEVTDHHAFVHASILKMLERWEDAARAFERVLDLNPENAEAMEGLAHSLLMVPDRRAGRRWARRAHRAGRPAVLKALKAGEYDQPKR